LKNENKLKSDIHLLMKNYEDEITIPNVQKQKEEPKTLCIANQKNSEYLERSEKDHDL